MIEGITNHLGFFEAVAFVLAICGIWVSWKASSLVSKLTTIEEEFDDYVVNHSREHTLLAKKYDDLQNRERANFDKVFLELQDIGKSLAFIQGHFDTQIAGGVK